MSTLEIMKHRRVELVEEDRYEHDCEGCDYIGSIAETWEHDVKPQHIDLYVCPNGGLGEPTVVARHGDEGPQYTSKPLSILYTRESDIKRWKRAKKILRNHIRVEYDPRDLPDVKYSLS